LRARNGTDVEVHVACSTGTYVRALARDVGATLGIGAHLIALRRTRSGPFTLEHARTLDELDEAFEVTPLATAVADAFPRIDVTEEEATRIGHGQRLALPIPSSPAGVFGPDGRVIALVEGRNGVARPLCVFA
jgi:tRNA pseudouridine55 synthase